jgi:phosphoribosylaminoimidazole-succinocarboxamide synthase
VEQVRGRAVVAKRLKPILVEAVVRGYIIGSGWKDYQATGAICGIKLPAGLQQAPSCPADLHPGRQGRPGRARREHQLRRNRKAHRHRTGPKIRDVAIQLYKEAADYAATRGIIIADTKFEFGLDDNGVLHLMDEVLTADSSRFWPADSYQVGISPPSFDKQFVRDYLETVDGWQKTRRHRRCRPT